MTPSTTSFFDTLIDRLVDDVRRELESELNSGGDAAQTPPLRVIQEPQDDLVSKMIGLRARIAPQAPIARRPMTSMKFDSESVHRQMSSLASPETPEPRFRAREAKAAFDLAVKAGARFTMQDLDADDVLHATALKRERRRVLLNLHPDRQPENRRAQAHTRFLEAADAFSTLAADAMALSEDRRREPQGRPDRAA